MAQRELTDAELSGFANVTDDMLRLCELRLRAMADVVTAELRRRAYPRHHAGAR